MNAVVHVPQFPLQAVLRHEPAEWARPVVLVDPASDTPRVMDLTGPARAAGVASGMTAPQALARCRDVGVRHRSPRAEATATDALLQAAFGFSPNLEQTSPGTVTLDLRGLSEWRGGGSGDGTAPMAWGARLHAVAAGLGLQARVGLGATPSVALHAARWPAVNSAASLVAGPVAWARDAAGFVASLPVEALDPTPHVLEILGKWGVSTVGALLALGQAELADRLGLEALGLFAAASTTARRPLRLARPAEHFEETAELGHPVETLEPLLFVLRRHAESLEARLAAFRWVAEVLVLRLRLESGAAWERRLDVPQPTRRAEVLFRMLQTHLDGVRTESAVTGATLSAEPARPVQRQFGLFEAALKDPHQFQETLARLSALVGADRVGSPVRSDGHRPGQFRLVPPDFDNAPPAKGRAAELARRTPWRCFRPPLPADVAAWLDPMFRPGGPDTVDAKVVAFPGVASAGAAKPVEPGADPSRRPASVRCTVAGGRIVEASGPWEASGRWWEADGWSRAEWDVSLRGGTVLRLVESGGVWTVEGAMD